MSFVTGTFSGADTSDPVLLKGGFSLSLVMASTGTVELQRQLPGQTTWQLVKTYTDASTDLEDEGVHGNEDTSAGRYRLECTAAGGNIDYVLGN